MSETTCHVFRPTEIEFSNFYDYITLIELQYPQIGICKIIPPSSVWKVKEIDVSQLDVTIKTPIRQKVIGRNGVYNVDLFELRNKTIQQFYEFAKELKYDETDFHERERMFWRSLAGTSGFGDPVYGADVPGTLFSSSDSLQQSPWNLNNLENVLNFIKKQLPGVNSPMLYVGSWRAFFAYHVEDMDLYSINYLHHGAAKSWYSVPPTGRKRLENLAQSYFMEEYRGCHEFLRHKTKLFSPTRLKENNIQFQTVLQFPGEFVVTFPGAYHSGFNHGFNIAEAINFATERWFPIGKSSNPCKCRSSSVFVNVDELECVFLRLKYLCREVKVSVRSAFKNNPVYLSSSSLSSKSSASSGTSSSLSFLSSTSSSSSTPSSSSSYFDSDSSYFTQEYEEEEMRIRCYCNKTIFNNENDDLVQCDFCHLYYHRCCLLERLEEYDDLIGESIDLEMNKCHICYQIENSDVYTLSQKAEKGKRKYKKRKPKEPLKESLMDVKKLESLPVEGKKQKNYDVICDTIDLTQDDDCNNNKAGCPLKSRFPDTMSSYPPILPKVKKLKIKEESFSSSSSSSVLSFSSPTTSSNLSLPTISQTSSLSAPVAEFQRHSFPSSSPSSSAVTLHKSEFISCGDYVRVTLPGNKLPSEGYIMDLEGKKGRFHIKGNNRDSDTWVSLSSCEKIIDGSVTVGEAKQLSLA
jgi:jumonji domain-containing protein 2